MNYGISLHSIEINNEVYFLQARFSDDRSCNVVLTNAKTSWKCDLVESSLAAFAKETSTELGEYYSLLKAALTGDPLQKDFQFSIAKRTTDTLTLEWKRVQKDVKFCLGTFNFEKIDDCESAIRSILSACCKSLKSYSSSLDLSKKNNDILTKEFEVLQNDMKKCVALKENLENELLAKFVLIINEKKAKIRSLQKRLENCEPIKVAEGSSNPPVKTISEVNLLPQKESIPSSKAQKLKLEDSFDGGPVIPKRKRTTNKQPLTLSISPAKKTKDTPVSPVKFPSDCTGSSSDSTVDVNDLLEEI